MVATPELRNLDLRMAIKRAKIAAKLKKAEWDFKHGDKRAKERVDYHRDRLIMHDLKYQRKNK